MRLGAIEAWLWFGSVSRLVAVITFLRLAGLVAASIWLGGTVLFVVALDPLFGRAEVVRLLGPLYTGEIGLMALQRFHLFQVLCAGVA